jgi:hypothetical protein
MRVKLLKVSVLTAIAAGCCGALFAQVALTNMDRLELHNVKAEPVNYQGRSAVRITDADIRVDDAGRIAVLRGMSFQDGTIEVTLSGDTAPNAAPELRGFVGIAFRVAPDASHFECFYLRPKNGRSQDQLQRNHSTQYISVPGFPWEKLRSETPASMNRMRTSSPGSGRR